MQRLGRIGLGAQHGLAAFRIALVGQVGLEDDAERLVEILRHRIEGQDAGLHDPAAQTAFDDDLAAEAAIDRHPGRKGRQAEEAEALGQRRALAVARRDVQRGAGRPHAVEVDDALDLGFLSCFQ